MVPVRTAPSHGIGRARILFCIELRYVGGSKDILAERIVSDAPQFQRLTVPNKLKDLFRDDYVPTEIVKLVTALLFFRMLSSFRIIFKP